MKIVEIIESKRWKNTKNGRTASIYGAHPAGTASERADWIIEKVGYTWRCDNGTVGLGRAPVATWEMAWEVMQRFNDRG